MVFAGRNFLLIYWNIKENFFGIVCNGITANSVFLLLLLFVCLFFRRKVVLELKKWTEIYF